MKTTLIASLIFSLGSFSAFADGTITVYRDHAQPLKVSGAKHLADLVSQPQLAGSWWLGAVISERQASVEAQAKHQVLLSRLASLAAEEGGEDGAAINRVRQQLQAMKVTGRQRVILDPDRVRVRAKNNPPLEGDYELWVGQQPSTITLTGLISSPGKKIFTPGKPVTDYLDEVSRLSGAERSYAWLIQPTGRVEKVPVAYWNKRHVEPMPGSILYVGFADHTFTSAYDGLNEQIISSLTHRIPD
ncbi:capsule biosynthesis GfcC D2 domain-containing protein [Cronobacter dublinensis]